MMEEVGGHEADDIQAVVGSTTDDESAIRNALQDAAQTCVTEALPCPDKETSFNIVSGAVNNMPSSFISSSMTRSTPLPAAAPMQTMMTPPVKLPAAMSHSTPASAFSVYPTAAGTPSSLLPQSINVDNMTKSDVAPQTYPMEMTFNQIQTGSFPLSRQNMSVPASYALDPVGGGAEVSTGVSSSMHVGPGALPAQGTTLTLPPPPTMGFVPAHGIVTANPHHAAAPPLAPPTNMSHLFTPTPVSQIPATEQINRDYSGMSGSSMTTSPHTMSAALPPSTYRPDVSMSLPYEVSSAYPSSYQPPDIEPSSPAKSESLFGWFPGSGLMHKVIEKTKSSVESVITTLDPGMKEVIYSGGNISVVVTSTKEVKVGAIRQAFQSTFGRATVAGMESQPNIAPQPVGYASGVRGANERIENLRQCGAVDEHQAVVSVENFIVELLPDRWYDVGCILLKDPRHDIELTTFSQATPVPADFVCAAQDATPDDYGLRWSGLAVTVGQVIQHRMPHVDHANWHLHFTGVSRRDMLLSAAQALAGMYRSKLTEIGYVF